MGPLPYGDRPDKKDGSRKESDMKLQWIKDILGDAYTDEMDAKVSAALGERFVSRADFNAKNNRVTELETQVGQLEEQAKTHATSLADLKKLTGDNEALTKKIGELEEQGRPTSWRVPRWWTARSPARWAARTSPWPPGSRR